MLDEQLQRDRDDMVARQLAARGIRSSTVLEAMRCVPREKFVPKEYASTAYGDRALPIGFEQTISQPYMVALMTERLELQGTEKVLEIGAGSGYQAAVLSRLAGEVISLERIAELARRAAEALEDVGCTNVKLVVGDGSLGWPPEAPYDRIIVTAAAESCPGALLEQLADPGILVIPVGPKSQQMLQLHRRQEGRITVNNVCPCRFVPLVGAEGRSQ